MYTDNRTEIYIRGEEGALSTPPRIAEIAKEIEQTGIKGWDGLFWKNQYEAFQQFSMRRTWRLTSAPLTR